MIRESLKKIFTIMLFTILVFVSSFSNVYGASEAATVSLNKTSAKAGEEVELYIDLGIESIAYDLKIELSDSSLIKSSELAEKIGTGSTSRIYLVQVVPESERTVHPVGTRIAKIKYVLSDDIKEEKSLTITVSGDVAGTSSSDKNTISKAVTVSISPKEEQPSNNEGNNNNGNSNSGNNEQNNNGGSNNGSNDNNGSNGSNNNSDGSNNGNSSSEETPKTTVRINPTDNTKKTTSSTLPYTGNEFGVLLIIAGLAIISIVSIFAYKKNNY